MSDIKKGRILAAVFAAFMAAVIVAFGVVIYNSPARISATTAGNYTANLMNGGYLLDDGNYIYYSIPGKAGAYTVRSDGSDNERFCDSNVGFLQTDSGSYFYTDGDKLMLASAFGQNKTTLLEYAKQPYVVGERVYYIDEDGYICKFLSWSGEKRRTDIKPRGQMAVYAGRIYYIADGGSVRRCALDGSEDKALEGVFAEKFSIDGKYLYTLYNGKVNSVGLSGDKVSVYTLCEADDFVINRGYIMYNKGGKCMLAEINRIIAEDGYKPAEVMPSPAKCLQIGDSCFYIYTETGITKLPFDTGKPEPFLTF